MTRPVGRATSSRVVERPRNCTANHEGDREAAHHPESGEAEPDSHDEPF
ncbi:hypothetical protein [Parasphingorhabdus flavimaris]